MADILIAMPAAIFIAAASSWITVQLSFRKFRHEKWWERKADAYANIIEALHYSKQFSEEHFEADMEGREISQDTDAELRAEAKKANAEISRVASMGAFLLPDQAINRLALLRKEENEASNATDWCEYIDRDLKATSSCLNDIIEIAKEDLKV
jgi:hypothetical protein